MIHQFQKLAPSSASSRPNAKSCADTCLPSAQETSTDPLDSKAAEMITTLSDPSAEPRSADKRRAYFRATLTSLAEGGYAAQDLEKVCRDLIEKAKESATLVRAWFDIPDANPIASAACMRAAKSFDVLNGIQLPIAVIQRNVVPRPGAADTSIPADKVTLLEAALETLQHNFSHDKLPSYEIGGSDRDPTGAQQTVADYLGWYGHHAVKIKPDAANYIERVNAVISAAVHRCPSACRILGALINNASTPAALAKYLEFCKPSPPRQIFAPLADKLAAAKSKPAMIHPLFDYFTATTETRIDNAVLRNAALKLLDSSWPCLAALEGKRSWLASVGYKLIRRFWPAYIDHKQALFIAGLSVIANSSHSSVQSYVRRASDLASMRGLIRTTEVDE